MKKILAVILLAITLLSVNINVFAERGSYRNPTKTTIKVGHLENYGVIATPMVLGSEGYGYEYFEKIEEYTYYDFEYVSLSWAEGLEQLKSGEIDILAPACMYKERKEFYDFVDTKFSYDETNIYALEDSDYNYDDPEQLNGKVFGTLEGSNYEKRFMAYAKQHNIEYTLKYTDPSTVVQDIESGEIDFYIDGTLFMRDELSSVGKVYSENLYLMVQKGNETLKENINSAMLAIEADDSFFNELLWYKYYANIHKAGQKLTEEEITALESKYIYTVGYHADLHPMSYKSSDGKPKGYAIDVMNTLADQLEINVCYVPLHDGSESSSEDVDFSLCPLHGPCTTIGNLSEPYDKQKLLIITNENLNKSDVQNILVKDYATIQIDSFLKQYKSATIHKAYSSTDSQHVYNTEDIDCIIIPDSSETLDYDKKAKNVQVLDASVPVGIMVSNKLPNAVRTALDKTILSLSETTVDELVMKSMIELQAKPNFIDTLIEYQWQILFVLLLIISLFIYILWKSRQDTKHLLEVDTLTGLMTPYKFTLESKRILSNAKENEYMMILLDIDKLKNINKAYGINFGDKLICVVAKSIREQAKTDAIITRIQGDTFAILTRTSGIDKETLYENFVKEQKIFQVDVTVYFSAGVYVIEDTTQDISFMLDNARTAKGHGKIFFGNTVNFFTKELQTKYEKESSILSSMEKSLKDGEFFIVMQPKVDLQTQKIVGGEVLIRWKKKDGKFVYPDEFIPLFEENKFIVQLDHYVLKKTCEFIRDSKLNLPVLSVNVSARTMLEPEFVQTGLKILKYYGVSPQQIEVELTESVLDFDFVHITNIISELKKTGFSVAIDDFGKGASSLARICEIEMDVLKLDKDFITNNTENEKGRLVLKNVISMANDLGITSLAEGVETKEQQELLVKLGCEEGQGYYFDRPLSIEDFAQRVEANSKLN